MSKDDVLYNYYSLLSKELENKIPIILYNIPQFSGISLSTNLVHKLSSIPNIIGIKDSTGNIIQINEYKQQTNKEFLVLSGSGSVYLYSLMVNADGCVSALGNLFPKECCDIYDFFKNHDFENAIKLQNKLIPINQLITSKYGIPGLKYALKTMGDVKFPLKELNDIEKLEIDNVLNNTIKNLN